MDTDDSSISRAPQNNQRQGCTPKVSTKHTCIDQEPQNPDNHNYRIPVMKTPCRFSRNTFLGVHRERKSCMCTVQRLRSIPSRVAHAKRSTATETGEGFRFLIRGCGYGGAWWGAGSRGARRRGEYTRKIRDHPSASLSGPVRPRSPPLSLALPPRRSSLPASLIIPSMVRRSGILSLTPSVLRGRRGLLLVS